jgi:tRNA(Ile)-lysidine synthase
VDSMVLLHLLHVLRPEFQLSLIVAHVNHGLRPEESEREKELVQKESERLGLPFEYGQFNVKDFGRAAGLSLQEAGRRIRCHFFKAVLSKHHARKIALGHHADDQVETVLIRLLRGSGLKGLKGLLPVREKKVIRPLFEIWKREIESFAREAGIPSLSDSSNFRRNYLRNRIRLDLIPLIEAGYQSNFKEVLIRTSAALREEDDYLEEQSEKAYQEIVSEGDACSFRFSEFESLHKAMRWRVLQRILKGIYSGDTELEEGQWLAALPVHKKLDRPPTSFLYELPQGVYLEKRYDRVSFRRGKEERVAPFEIELMVPGPTLIEEIGRKVTAEQTTGRGKGKDPGGFPNVAFFDYEKLRFPLKMRNFRPGDRFEPLGVKGTQKVKEFFIDHKIPRFERPRVPLLISGEAVAWVVGYRIDERVRVTDETRRIFKVEVT